MTRYVQLLVSSPVEGQEAEYHRWYEQEHIPDALKVPGFVGAQRFKVDGPSTPSRFAVLYEIESENPAATLAEAMSRVKSGAIRVSPSLDRTKTIVFNLVPIGERVTRP